MAARYLTDENGKRLFVILGIEEYERLREIEDEMEDVCRYNEAMARCGRYHPLGAGQAGNRAREGRAPR